MEKNVEKKVKTVFSFFPPDLREILYFFSVHEGLFNHANGLEINSFVPSARSNLVVYARSRWRNDILLIIIMHDYYFR